MKKFLHGFTINYDELTDTLYISEDKPRKALSYMDENYVIVRKLNEKICGVTIDGYKSRHQDHSWNDNYILRYLPNFIISDLKTVVAER